MFKIAIILFVVTCMGRGVNHNAEEMINFINNKAQTTWTAHKNFLNGERDIKTLLGTYINEPVRELPKANDDLPEEFDAREKWGKMCPSLYAVRDQGPCGSCWAFGAATAMSDRLCIASNGTFNMNLSAEDILSCCKMCGNGCRGGFPMAAWKYWEEHGVPTGGQFGDKKACRPYAFRNCDHHVVGKYKPCDDIKPTPKCHHKCTKVSGLHYKQDLTNGGIPSSIIGETAMKEALSAHGSIECAFIVYEDFIHYKSGVYQHVSGVKEGGHAIRILGWGVENSVKYWLVANSWNEDWGDKGYFKILRGENHVGIEQFCVASVPNV